ncbi:hypothetical protein V5T82_03830 [Magnetovibrio sp. PR-2]|uniref:hypothetical protein n=1 Tax=Magnetovibrio sp. PR-2 TaxID=3120356 RepID=UPI002FCDFAE7
MNDHVLIAFGFVIGAIVTLMGVQLHLFSALSSAFWSFAGAIGGAAVTVIGATLLSTRKAKEQNRRKLLAARAILASDLSAICSYTKQCALVLKQWVYVVENPSALNQAPPLPELDKDILLRLRDIIEFEDGDEALRLVDLLHCHQIYSARQENVYLRINDHSRAVSRNDIMSPLRFLLEFDLRARSLFHYARGTGKDVSPPFTEEQVQSAVFFGLEVFDWLQEVEKARLQKSILKISKTPKWRQSP